MQDGLKSFMTNLGILCETWVVVYNNFVKLGLDRKDAISHTKEFMSSMVNGVVQNGGK